MNKMTAKVHDVRNFGTATSFHDIITTTTNAAAAAAAATTILQLVCPWQD